MSGGSAALVHLLLLFIFHKIFDLRIVFATSIAFTVSFFVSFFLQKIWTFRDNCYYDMHRQMFIYLLVSLVNMGINAVSMYFLVEIFRVWYLLAQVIVSAAIAVESFLIYSHFIFKKKLSV